MSETGAIAQISRARQFLAEAKDLSDIKAVRDMAEAARLYARAAGLGQDAMNEAAEIKLRAERMAGAALAEMKKHEGGRPEKTDSRTESVSDVPRLADMGITPKQSMNWQAEASVPEPVFEQHIAETKAAGEPLTTASVVRLARPTPRRVPDPESVEAECFLCPECGDEFTLRVWHCPECTHHWANPGDDVCKNCLSSDIWSYRPGFTPEPDDPFAGGPRVGIDEPIIDANGEEYATRPLFDGSSIDIAALPRLDPPEEEKVYSALVRLIGSHRLNPKLVADESHDPAQMAEHFELLAAWIGDVAKELRSRGHGLRAVR